jgi:hypothetical protein
MKHKLIVLLLPLLVGCGKTIVVWHIKDVIGMVILGIILLALLVFGIIYGVAHLSDAWHNRKSKKKHGQD